MEHGFWVTYQINIYKTEHLFSLLEWAKKNIYYWDRLDCQIKSRHFFVF